VRESEFRLALTQLTSSEVERYRHPSLRSSYCHHRQFRVRLHATSCRLHRLWLSLVCSRIRKTAHRNRMRPRRLRKDGSPHSLGSASGAIRALIRPPSHRARHRFRAVSILLSRYIMLTARYAHSLAGDKMAFVRRLDFVAVRGFCFSPPIGLSSQFALHLARESKHRLPVSWACSSGG